MSYMCSTIHWRIVSTDFCFTHYLVTWPCGTLTLIGCSPQTHLFSRGRNTWCLRKNPAPTSQCISSLFWEILWWENTLIIIILSGSLQHMTAVPPSLPLSLWLSPSLTLSISSLSLSLSLCFLRSLHHYLSLTHSHTYTQIWFSIALNTSFKRHRIL